MKVKATTMENSREFLKILKIELPYDPAIPLLGIYLKKTKTLIWKDICTPLFIAALFTIAKIWKQPYIYSNGILLSHKIEWNLTICNKTDGPQSVLYTKWNKLDKDKYCMISLICGI